MNLSTDPSFDVNLLRWIGTAPYHGADVDEVLDLAGSRPARSRAGIRSSSLSPSASHEGWPDQAASPVTRRDRAFRAAAY